MLEKIRCLFVCLLAAGCLPLVYGPVFAADPLLKSLHGHIPAAVSRMAAKGIVPATRALISPIELAAGKQAYFIGKPNPLMMRTARKPAVKLQA